MIVQTLYDVAIGDSASFVGLFVRFAVLGLSVAWCVRKIHESRGSTYSNGLPLPPGPSGIPLLGYYPFLGARPHEKLAALKKKYGGVYGLTLGRKYCVVLNDIDALKEAYSKDALNARPPNSPFDIAKNTRSLIQFVGKQWTDQRRFSLQVLRNLGFGKTRMEDVIRKEVRTLFEEFEKSDRGPTEFHRLLAFSTANVIGFLLFGRHIPFDDSRRSVIDDYLRDISDFHAQFSPHSMFPWAKRILLNMPMSSYKRALQLIKRLSDFNQKEIEQHGATLDPDCSRDYIDSFLIENKQPDSDKSTFSKDVLNGNIGLFLRAGSLTTRATVEWALLATAIYPDIQSKVHEEIDKVIGRGRTPDWADHNKMRYTMAVLTETQRWRTIVPINLLRYTYEETSVKGFRIPANTLVVSNLWAIHNDPSYWDKPEEFKPERMLNEEGTELIKTDSFVSFSLGRRACPGQSLANMEMFLYYATIMQRYHVTLPAGDKMPTAEDMKGITHITAHPKNLRLSLTNRD